MKPLGKSCLVPVALIVLVSLAWIWRSAGAAEDLFQPVGPTAPLAASETLSDEIELCNFPEGCPQCSGWDWRDTFSTFVGYEGSKQPQDFGVNAHFGGRWFVNWGAPLVRDWGLGLQVGNAINATANAVQVNERLVGNDDRFQNFTTVGLFQRLDNGWRWGLAYDFLFQDYYDNFNLGQWRGRVGRRFEWDEIGVQVALHQQGDEGAFGAQGVFLRPIDQGSVYYRRWFEFGGMLGMWTGLAEGHNEPNIALGDLPRQDDVFVYGAEVFIPLNDRLAVFGEANFLTPADTGTVDSFLGVQIFPWGGSRRAQNRRFAPLQSVGGNTQMSVDLFRQ